MVELPTSPIAPVPASSAQPQHADQPKALHTNRDLAGIAPIREPTITVCQPIVALGETAALSHASAGADAGDAPFRVVRDGDGYRTRLHASNDWIVISPRFTDAPGRTAASAEAVLDVYLGLLAAFASTDPQSDNVVRFTPAEFLRGLSWGTGSQRGAPTGRHYRQLDLALDYLRDASIESEPVRVRLESLLGVRILRANFSVLQSWTKSASVVGVGRPVQIEARFSDLFAALLRDEGRLTRYCATQYARLPRGVPRALFRYIEGLRTSATGSVATIAVPDLLARIGSRRRNIELSRVRDLLDEPHQILVANGVLGALPSWSTSKAGELQVEYVLETTSDIAGLAEETALTYGVTERLAADWAATRLDRLVEVLAAVSQGILTPTRSIARLLYHYVVAEHGPIDPKALPHFEEGRGLLRPKQRCREFEYLEEEYYATHAWLSDVPAVDQALRRQFAGSARAEWVTDGLVLLTARRLRGAPSVMKWKTRHR